MSKNKGPLGVHENQTVVQGCIEGLSGWQVPVVNRLRQLGVPPDLIGAATNAEEDSFEYVAAENAIIAYLRGSRHIEEEEALLLLNGKKTFTS